MNRIFKIISLLLFSFSLVAQNESNSPYSRFGLGDIQNFSTANQSAMGGTGIAIYDPLLINLNNPASYSSVFTTLYYANWSDTHY